MIFILFSVCVLAPRATPVGLICTQWQIYFSIDCVLFSLSSTCSCFYLILSFLIGKDIFLMLLFVVR